MSYVRVQHPLGVTNTSPAGTLALAGSVVASGNLVVGHVAWFADASQTLSSVTDDKGNTYNISDQHFSVAADLESFAIFWLNNITNGPNTVTCHFSANTAGFDRMAWSEFSGVDTSGTPTDGHTMVLVDPGGTGTDAVTTGNITTTIDGDLIYAAEADTQGQASWTAGTNFTPNDITAAGDATHQQIGAEWLTQSTHGNIAGTFTESVASRTLVGVIAFKPAAGAVVATDARTANLYAPKLGPKFSFKPQLAFPPSGIASTVVATQGVYTLTGNSQTLSNEVATYRGLAAPTLFSPMLGPGNRFRPVLAFPPASAVLTLSAAQGTYTLTGNAVALNSNRSIAAAQGTYTLTGEAQTLNRGRSLTAVQGTYTLTGEPQTLNRGIGMSAVQGTYTINGQAQSLLRGRPIAAVQGTYTLTGEAVTFPVALSLHPQTGIYSLNGRGVVLTLTPSGQAAVSHSNPFFATPGPMTSIP